MFVYLVLQSNETKIADSALRQRKQYKSSRLTYEIVCGRQSKVHERKYCDWLMFVLPLSSITSIKHQQIIENIWLLTVTWMNLNRPFGTRAAIRRPDVGRCQYGRCHRPCGYCVANRVTSASSMMLASPMMTYFIFFSGNSIVPG